MVSFEQRPEYLDFANSILGTKFNQPDCSWISSHYQGALAGVVVYSRFTPWNCEMSVASNNPRFLTRELLHKAFWYPFVQCKLSRVTAVVEDGNERALRMNRGIGFEDEGRLEGWFGERDGLILKMLKGRCRWI